MLPPAARPDVPLLRITSGGLVRVRLAFAAASATASIDGHAISVRRDSTLRVVAWRATRGGLLVLSVRNTPAGSASYLARIVLSG